MFPPQRWQMQIYVHRALIIFGIADFLGLLLALNLFNTFQGGLFKKTLVGW